jgi:hypothetical protein
VRLICAHTVNQFNSFSIYRKQDNVDRDEEEEEENNQSLAPDIELFLIHNLPLFLFTTHLTPFVRLCLVFFFHFENKIEILKEKMRGDQATAAAAAMLKSNQKSKKKKIIGARDFSFFVCNFFRGALSQQSKCCYNLNYSNRREIYLMWRSCSS